MLLVVRVLLRTEGQERRCSGRLHAARRVRSEAYRPRDRRASLVSSAADWSALQGRAERRAERRPSRPRCMQGGVLLQIRAHVRSRSDETRCMRHAGVSKVPAGVRLSTVAGATLAGGRVAGRNGRRGGRRGRRREERCGGRSGRREERCGGRPERRRDRCGWRSGRCAELEDDLGACHAAWWPFLSLAVQAPPHRLPAPWRQQRQAARGKRRVGRARILRC